MANQVKTFSVSWVVGASGFSIPNFPVVALARHCWQDRNVLYVQVEADSAVATAAKAFSVVASGGPVPAGTYWGSVPDPGNTSDRAPKAIYG